jgi:hypothetical protein
MSSKIRAFISRGIEMLAGVAGVVVLFRLYAIYAAVGLRLNYDEAEHMHAAFLIERGERPYLDFIENHPMLFNLGILALNRIFPQDTVRGLYMAARLLVLLAFIGCIYFAYQLCRDYSRRAGSAIHAGSLLLLVFVFFELLPPASSYMWDVRPDWFCYLLSLVCVHAHYRVHAGLEPSSTSANFVTVGLAGVVGGLATAILPKSVFIFAPYALVCIVVFAGLVRRNPQTIGRLAATNGIFAGTGIVGFCMAVAFELHATGATLASYYKANFVINRLNHPVASLQNTPLSQLDALAGIGLPSLIVLALASIALLATLFRNRKRFEFCTLLFALTVVGFNSALLAVTNGAYWIHNFAPSLLGLVVAGFVLLHSATNWLFSRFVAGPEHSLSEAASKATPPILRWSAAFLLALLAAVTVANRLSEAARDYRTLEFSQSLQSQLASGKAAEFVVDRILPSDLTYLVFTPDSVPVRARHWGYYFMLMPDRGFWMDTYALGIGPDAKTYWRRLYAHAPPDVVVLSDRSGDLSYLRDASLRNQEVDISWLEPALRRDYLCFTQLGISAYVRPEHAPRFSQPEWRRCSP